MAKLPPAEQWCVCGVGQPHRRCQDRETLQPSLYTRKYGAMCRLGYLDKWWALYGKKKEEQERRPLTRAQYTSISGIFGVHCSPRSPSSPHIDPDSDSDSDSDQASGWFSFIMSKARMGGRLFEFQ